MPGPPCIGSHISGCFNHFLCHLILSHNLLSYNASNMFPDPPINHRFSRSWLKTKMDPSFNIMHHFSFRIYLKKDKSLLNNSYNIFLWLSLSVVKIFIIFHCTYCISHCGHCVRKLKYSVGIETHRAHRRFQNQALGTRPMFLACYYK